MNAPVSLEEAAVAREQARVRVAAAEAAVKALEPGMNAARFDLGDARAELARIELALRSATRAHLVTAAVEALGIETSEPPLVVVPSNTMHSLPTVYELVGLAANGVGLYVGRMPHSGRRGGRKHAIRSEHVPAAVMAHITAPRLEGSEAYNQRHRELLALLGLPYADVTRVHRSDVLVQWETKGRGDFGAGSGATKPIGPPDGGRWRRLKVADELQGISAPST